MWWIILWLHYNKQRSKMDKFLKYAAAVFGLLSPELKQDLREAIEKMEARAKQTKLPFDDIAVMILKGLIG